MMVHIWFNKLPLRTGLFLFIVPIELLHSGSYPSKKPEDHIQLNINLTWTQTPQVLVDLTSLSHLDDSKRGNRYWDVLYRIDIPSCCLHQLRQSHKLLLSCFSKWSQNRKLLSSKFHRALQGTINKNKTQTHGAKGNVLSVGAEDSLGTKESQQHWRVLQRLLSAWPALTRVNGGDCFVVTGRRKRVWKLEEKLRGVLSETLIGPNPKVVSQFIENQSKQIKKHEDITCI